MPTFLNRVFGKKPKPVTSANPATITSSNRSEARPVGLTPRNLRAFMERVPISYLAVGRITESDLALAATTPILGQYAPTFGFPEDWGWYWEYLDAYMFIPEVAFAVKDRKSTRLNSSHDQISYAVFCLKKKRETHYLHTSSQP